MVNPPTFKTHSYMTLINIIVGVLVKAGLWHILSRILVASCKDTPLYIFFCQTLLFW